MNFEQQWLENDYNPFIHFSSSGKILSLNTEAQFLLGSASNHEVYQLATTYASKSFGFKTTFIELEFGGCKFFALTIGYEDEESVGIKLYQVPHFKLNKPKPTGELVNIYTLVDLCISSNSISSKTNYIKDFDPTIPEIILDINNFIKILNKIYLCFEKNKDIKTKIFYRIGEHLKFAIPADKKSEDSQIKYKKYSIFSIEINAKIIDEKRVNELKAMMQDLTFYLDIGNSIRINIPMITE